MAPESQRIVFGARTESKRVHRLDRLYVVASTLALLASTALLGGCDEGDSAESKANAPSGRVNAVQADDPEPAPPPKAFCDKYVEGKGAEAFEFPELRETPPEEPEGWRWVNIWATWCKPCVEEMPRLVEWRERLREHGLGDLVLVSVDESREKIEAFREKNPETPESLLIAEPKAVKPWVESLGLSAGAPLPVHVFVDPENRVRCLRAGGVGEDDYRAVKRLLGS